MYLSEWKISLGLWILESHSKALVEGLNVVSLNTVPFTWREI